MKIPAISNPLSSLSNMRNNLQARTSNTVPARNNTISFKGIYVEDIVDLGDVAESSLPAKFLKKDALLLNEIAQDYPNQDCFIRKGYGGMPRLEYREKPPVVQTFSNTVFKQYNVSIDPDDKEYPVEPLLLYEDSPLNRMIGLTSFISLNPSLPYTIKAGFELHKKLLEKKQQIMDVVGKTDGVDLGEETLIEKAHKAIADVEEAVTRYLLESAYVALTDRASASQIYASNYPKVQSRLDAKRTLDLTTSVAKQPEPDNTKEKIDICEVAMKMYPDYQENKEANAKLLEYMSNHGIIIG